MSFSLTRVRAYGIEAEEALNKRSKQVLILNITGLSTDNILDLGNFTGTFWTQVGATGIGPKALAVMQSLQVNVDTFIGVSGSSIAGYAQTNGAGSSAGSVDSVNGQVGDVVITLDDLFTGGSNKFVITDDDGFITTLPGFSYDPVTFAASFDHEYQPDNGSGAINFFNQSLVLRPQQNTASQSYGIGNYQINIDPDSSGFDIGTNGQAAVMQNYYYNHQGTSDTGSLQYVTMYGDIGNGTDAISVNGMIAAYFAPQIRANVTIDGQVQGFYFSPSANAAAIMSTSSGFTAFGDFPQLPVSVFGYTSFGSSPQISEIQNNSNYTGINLNPSIDSLTGNAAANMIALAGTFGELGTGGFRGISLFPTITDLNENSSGVQIGGTSVSGDADWSGLNINTQNINTTGNTWGLQIQTDVTLASGAIDSSGRNNLAANFDIVDGQGQMYGNVIGGQVNVPNGTAITGTDILANNMAFTVNTGDASSSFTASSPVGLTSLGFVGQIIGDGDVTGGINFCLNGYSMAANTGVIDRINNFYAAAIPGGGTATIDEAVLFYGQMPFGLVGTDNWGVRIDTPTLENYLPTMAMGDMASKKVANSSVLLDLDSTTRALLVPRMDATEESSLTAINGMILYNLDTNEFRGYKNGAWANL